MGVKLVIGIKLIIVLISLISVDMISSLSKYSKKDLFLFEIKS